MDKIANISVRNTYFKSRLRSNRSISYICQYFCLKFFRIFVKVQFALKMEADFLLRLQKKIWWPNSGNCTCKFFPRSKSKIHPICTDHMLMQKQYDWLYCLPFCESSALVTSTLLPSVRRPRARFPTVRLSEMKLKRINRCQ